MINDEGMYRQIQHEPDGHYFRQDQHNQLTGQSRRVFRRLRSPRVGLVCVRDAQGSISRNDKLYFARSVAKFPQTNCATGDLVGVTYIG